MNFFLIIFFFILFFILYKSNDQQIYIQSSFDHKFYLVNKQNRNKEYTSRILSIIKHKMIELTENIKVSKENIIYINNLKEKIYQTKFVENKNIFPKPNITSYSLNKGEKIVLCVYDYRKQEFYDLNTLIFVSIHELAHIANPTIGHDESFYYIFNILLNQAIFLKIYTFYNYEKIPKKYCGIIINSNI